MTKPTSKDLDGILFEDWGSSDWSAAMNYMNKSIESNGGVTPENVTAAAEDTAEFYYDMMGYASPDEAVDGIISTWAQRSGWSDFFSPRKENILVDNKAGSDITEALDRHGRIKVPHWGSDDEKEEGTVKASLRKLPPKRSINKKKKK